MNEIKITIGEVVYTEKRAERTVKVPTKSKDGKIKIVEQQSTPIIVTIREKNGNIFEGFTVNLLGGKEVSTTDENGNVVIDTQGAIKAGDTVLAKYRSHLRGQEVTDLNGEVILDANNEPIIHKSSGNSFVALKRISEKFMQ